MLYPRKGDEGGKGTLGWITALVISRVAVDGLVWPSGWGRGASELWLALWSLGVHWAVSQDQPALSLQYRLNCGAWWEPSSDFCLLAYIAANKQPGCALLCHWLDKLICCFSMSLMWNRENNSGLRSHKLTQKYPDCQLEICPRKPEQQHVLCHTFHCDLVLPSSWVGVQVDLDGHFSYRIIHTGACWKKMDTWITGHWRKALWPQEDNVVFSQHTSQSQLFSQHKECHGSAR